MKYCLFIDCIYYLNNNLLEVMERLGIKINECSI